MPIEFSNDKDKWIMKISKEGKITFNTAGYPESKPDDFAKAVIEILENSQVNFENIKKNCFKE